MNPLLILFVLSATVTLAVIWRSLSRPAQTLGGRRSGYQTEDTAREAGQAVHRLFSPADDAMAATAGKKLARRFRSNRRYALRLYLRQMRGDFRHASQVARDAAAHSESPDASLRIVKLTVEFYGLQAALYAQHVFGLKVLTPAILLPRVNVLRQLS